LPRDPALGKAGIGFLQDVIYSRLGASRRGEVLVGPKFGVDNAVIRIGGGRVLVVTTDPVSLIPELGARDSAWLSVHLLASDLATCGFTPQFGIFDFNLPPEMKDPEFSDYWKAFHTECRKLGIAIVGGHTGRYPGCSYSIIGGGAMYAAVPQGQYLVSTMAEDGDDLILTKGAAMEATAVLTRAFPRTVKKALGARLFEKAWRYLEKVSTVRDSIIAVSVGRHREGVTAMHDATEGGVVAAALELANASRLGAELELDNILVSQETEEICKLFQIDPLISVSEGSLIAACKPHKTAKILNRLRSAGINGQLIGRLTSTTRSVYGRNQQGRTRLRYPRADPYWPAYWKAIRKRWK
jgi:hydrogenase maturation factor